LKTLEAERESAGETPAANVGLPNEPAGAVGASRREDSDRAEAARLRGIATHRMLELLEFSHCGTAEALARQIEELCAAKRLTAEEAGRADLDGIRWFLWESVAGDRLRATAQEIVADQVAKRTPILQIRRELPFTWLAPPHSASVKTQDSSDPADFPTIRGIIDVLLANTGARSAEILDYKTDRLWQPRLEEYRRQMGYYLAAASDILGFPVARATLVFLAPRREVVVEASRGAG
jgi:ATP-dependent exoDNAse (exonuclease V) beta subunit